MKAYLANELREKIPALFFECQKAVFRGLPQAEEELLKEFKECEKGDCVKQKMFCRMTDEGERDIYLEIITNNILDEGAYDCYLFQVNIFDSEFEYNTARDLERKKHLEQ